jgi:phage FluMu protein gp41
MRELSHSDHFLKQLKSQRVNWKKVNADISMTSPKKFMMLMWQRQVATFDWADDADLDQWTE